MTQPVGELVAGLNDNDAMTVLKRIDALVMREDFGPNAGPCMLEDSGDGYSMELLEQALSTLQSGVFDNF